MEYLSSTSPAGPPSLFDRLLQFAKTIALVDIHAHPFLYDVDLDEKTNATIPPLEEILSESAQVSSTAPAASAKHTLTFSRSIRDMLQLFSRLDLAEAPTTSAGFEYRFQELLRSQSTIAQQAAVEGKRKSLGVYKLAQVCIDAAKISAILVDDGLPFPPGKRPISVREFQKHLSVPVARRVLRLETEAEILLADMVFTNQLRTQTEASTEAAGNARLFRKLFRQHVESQLHDVVSFKSIVAYRSSLKVNVNVDDIQLEQALSELLNSLQAPHSHKAGHSIRLSHPVIINVVVTEGLNLARQHQIPIQFHCGFGDPDLDLCNANPALLHEMIHKFPDVSIVLLHGAWPYVREAAFLSSNYPNVYVDIGLAIPLLSVRGMTEMLTTLFEVAPLDRIMYSSDAHTTPDMFYLAARWGRRVVAAVVAASVASADLTVHQATEAVAGILANNAIRLYRLPLPKIFAPWKLRENLL